MLDYHAETAGVTVAVATDGGPDHVYVGSAGSGNGRVDLALGVERYFGAQGGANWIDLAASTLPTTLRIHTLGRAAARSPSPTVTVQQPG